MEEKHTEKRIGAAAGLISGQTGLLGVIGSPVRHSLSPAMFNYSLKQCGLDFVYLAFEIGAKEVPDAIRAMRTMGIRGWNVTMPNKVAVMQELDVIDPAAELIGAVNTIVNDHGVLTGYCTDGCGFVQNLRANGVEIRGRHIAVAGAGGAAKAIQVQSALDGARAVTILQRKSGSYETAQKTAETIRGAVPDCAVRVIDLDDTRAVSEAIASADLFANATRLGMRPMDAETPIRDPGCMNSALVVADAVYDPIETRLLREARAAGCRVIDGRGMLLWQGAEAFRLFTGEEMPVEEVHALIFEQK